MSNRLEDFWGMAGYYRRFIEGFSKIAGPMTKLLRKNTPFVWSDECEASFQTLKEKLEGFRSIVNQKNSYGCEQESQDLI
jgi:hypothetical protein